MRNLQKQTLRWSSVVLVAVLFSLSCATRPEPPLDPEPKPKPPAKPAGFVMQPHHIAMSEQMADAYEKADEIVIGIYTGSREDEQFGQTYYFDDFSRFDKTTMTWGPAQKVLLPVLPHAFKPDIITLKEFNYLTALDKVGICWDYQDDIRFVYLIQGKPMLLFLDHVFDEINDRSYRNLLDAYPVTSECNAKAVFTIMLNTLK